MLAIHATPTLGKSLVDDRAHVTVPIEIANQRCGCTHRQPDCRGFSPGDLPVEAGPLAQALLSVGKAWIRAMSVRGRDLRGDIRVHGPWRSMDFAENVSDPTDSMWEKAREKPREYGTYADPTEVLGAVFSPNPNSPNADYYLVGQFVARDYIQELPDG